MDDSFESAAASARLRLDLIAAERQYLHQLLREGKITDESRRRLERELDLEEASIACKAESGNCRCEDRSSVREPGQACQARAQPTG